MYTAGNILYFSPFEFPNGANPKNKYFIILNSSGENTLIASLPTSKDHIPDFIEKKHGCIDRPDICFNCYFFEENRPVTENGWGFPRETYVYGPQVTKFNRNKFEDIYMVEGVDYDIIGKLHEDEFNAIISCIRNSKTVKRKIRRALGAKI